MSVLSQPASAMGAKAGRTTQGAAASLAPDNLEIKKGSMVLATPIHMQKL